MRVNAGMPIYHSVAEVTVPATDHLHHIDENENAVVHRKKAQ